MERLGGIDSAFVFLDGEAMPMHVGGMIIYDPSTAPGGTLTHDQLRQHIADRITRAPVMHRKLVRVPFDLDNPWWVHQDSVDLDHHVSRIALPQPADWRELCHHVGRFLARPVDLKRPPWELCFIEGLDNIDGLPAGAFAMLMKIHHSVIDGVSGMEMAAGLHDFAATPSAPPPARGWSGRGTVHRRLARAGAASSGHPAVASGVPHLRPAARPAAALAAAAVRSAERTVGEDSAHPVR